MEFQAKRQKYEEIEENCDEVLPRFSISSVPPSLEEPTDTEVNHKDLPLLANIEDVGVMHYLMKLKFDMSLRIVRGVIILFLKYNSDKEVPEIVLDCCSINVHRVSALKLISREEISSEDIFEQNQRTSVKNFYKQQQGFPNCFISPEAQKLQFNVKKWSLNISGWSLNQFPSVIRIEYETLPTTPSLHWRPCQGFDYTLGPKCAYTPASPVNNRGLFPCQEPPTAMATWECFTETDSEYVSLLSSDEPSEFINRSGNVVTNYFYCSMILPMSTFAVVVGVFPVQIFDFVLPQTTSSSEQQLSSYEEQIKNENCNHDNYPCLLRDNLLKSKPLHVIPVRLFSILQDVDLHIEQLSKFVARVLKVAFEILGPHPFSRLDLVTMPRCFPSLGLANPNMTFLSPSVFAGNSDPLCYTRIAHEIGHSWFGLLIGALDWTEEWLSEGFATFIEEIIFKAASDDVSEEQLGLKSCLWLQTLRNELENTDTELQILSSNAVNTSEATSQCVKNGLVPDKQFMQIHYLKGYFLLKHLSQLVGQEQFLRFLKMYIIKYHGQLVTSSIFLQFFNSYFFKELQSNPAFTSIEDIRTLWLENHVLVEPLKSMNIFCPKVRNQSTKLFTDCPNSLLKIQNVFSQCKKSSDFSELKTLSSQETIVFLERVLELPYIPKLFYKTLMLSENLNSETCNPDVLHRCCEIIIRCKDKSRLKIIEEFLLQHPAMGVYLYCELMISERNSFQRLAKRLYHIQETVLHSPTLTVLKEMIF